MSGILYLLLNVCVCVCVRVCNSLPDAMHIMPSIRTNIFIFKLLIDVTFRPCRLISSYVMYVFVLRPGQNNGKTVTI